MKIQALCLTSTNITLNAFRKAKLKKIQIMQIILKYNVEQLGTFSPSLSYLSIEIYVDMFFNSVFDGLYKL